MKVGIIYMASGFGKRFGSNKLLEKWNGKPIYRYGLEALLEAAGLLKEEHGWQVRLTAVSQYEEIRKAAENSGAEALDNPFSHEGITASIRLGTESMGPDMAFYVYCTADQPRIDGRTVADFLYEFSKTSYGIGCVSAEGKKGNPAVFRNQYREELMALTGDRGGSQIMKRYPQDVWYCPVAEEMLADVDVPEELERLREEDAKISTTNEAES